MYVPTAFAEQRPEVLHDLFRAQPLATVVTSGAQGLLATPVPLLLDENGRELHGHFARANPHWRDLDGEVLAIFNGPDFYVTPQWYIEKQRSGRVVPTWNYVAVHVYGRACTWDDPAQLRAFLRRLTDTHEHGLDQPWSIDDAPADYIDNLLRTIVGFTIRIERTEGKWKLNQNRSDEDRAGVIAGLETAGAHDLAELMRSASRKTTP